MSGRATEIFQTIQRFAATNESIKLYSPTVRRPIVTTRAKGVRGVVVENETALLTDVGNPKELAQQLARLIENPGLRRRLGMTGRKRVAERFDWDTIVDTLLGVLESGLGDKDASGDRPRRSCVSR